MSDVRGLSLLVVTDNRSVRDQLEYGFSGEVEVEFARESRDAWSRLGEHVPDAVVVDLQTGSAGGYALARDMNSTKRLRDVPIVILIDRYQDEWLARQAGAAAVFVKPVEAGELLAAITNLIPDSPAA